MSIFSRIKDALTPRSYPVTEFGMENMEFFVALLRACPAGSRITFDQDEPESFVREFRKWSHREKADGFEADYYVIDDAFTTLAAELAGKGALELYNHFGISSPQGELLCTSWDDFMIVKLADELKGKIGRD